MRRHMLVGLIGAGLLCIAACNASDGTSSPVDASARDVPSRNADAGQEADLDGEDVEQDAGSPAAQRDTDEGEGDDRPREESLTRFNYQIVKPTCVGDCTEGVAVQFVTEEIIKMTTVNELRKDLDPEDYQRLDSLLRDDAVVRRMKGGWKCGDERKHDGVEYQFQSRLRFSDVRDPQIRTVSGCIPRNSPHRDRRRVRDIVDVMESMKQKYFDE